MVSCVFIQGVNYVLDDNLRQMENFGVTDVKITDGQTAKIVHVNRL